MKTRKWGGWEQLICPYFAPVCRRVLGSYLEGHGFTEKKPDEVGGLLFSRFDVFLEISYELETFPNYQPTVVLGVGEGRYDEGGRPCGIPFWYLVPDNLEARRYTFWTFKDEAELETSLAKIKDELLESYARPLWQNREGLEKVIRNFRAEFGC